MRAAVATGGPPLCLVHQNHDAQPVHQRDSKSLVAEGLILYITLTATFTVVPVAAKVASNGICTCFITMLRSA